ncbi:Transaldolase [Musa troglodytarum]|uniref:Transaldolase n=1 Tax=Musa troglodytarum TaxID=320322 RepID=A0A9E7JFJ5_9LILI|nr:Transaldolase [Musa troglodytarum]
MCVIQIPLREWTPRSKRVVKQVTPPDRRRALENWEMAVSLPSSSPLPASLPSNLLTRSRLLSPLSHALQLKRLLASSPAGRTRSFSLRSSSPRVGAFAADSSSAVGSELSTELDAVSRFSEIVPDTVSAIETALADSACYEQDDPNDRLSCFCDKALVNVGTDLARLVPGRVSTEVDARLAYDAHGIVRKVHRLLQLYYELEVPSERLLFKIPSTWQGIEAAKLLESEGIQTHLTFVYSFPQAAAAAQAGASVIQIFVGRIRDWSRNHTGDPELDAICRKGEDPGLELVAKAYNYIHKYGHKSKLMVAAIRNKQDIFSLLGVDYMILPLKILQSLKESITYPDEKYSFVRKLSPSSAMTYNFSQEELVNWDEASFSSAMGPASKELLAAVLEGYANQTKRVEELFGKIWPPPNV